MTVSRRSTLASLAGLGASVTLPAATAATTPAVSPDAAILALGRDLDEAVVVWRAQVGVDTDEPADRCYDLCLQIETSPAVTLDGLRVKARAFSFYYADAHDGRGADPLGSDTFRGFGCPTADVRLVQSILLSLLQDQGYDA